jgi:hypothetical protein
MARTRSVSPVLTALNVGVILVLLALVILLAPFGYYEVKRRWFFYTHRDGMRCYDTTPCHEMPCAPPKAWGCRKDHHDLKHFEVEQGVCTCQEW